jgi:hypothetical protein
MTRNPLLILGFILAIAAGLRFYGLDWGTDHQTGTFHTFHPDEKTLIDSAALIGDDMSKIVSSYGKAPMYFLALYTAIRLPDTRIYLYIAFGLAIGFATGTRLVGVWLAIPFVLAHIYSQKKQQGGKGAGGIHPCSPAPLLPCTVGANRSRHSDWTHSRAHLRTLPHSRSRSLL